ncbi:hypothetical protein BJX70DRAFT_396734 [Aspergillus crustosus]
MAPRKDDSWDLKSPEVERGLGAGEFEDCFACKATGSAAFIGLGVYSYHTGMANLRKQEKAILLGPTKYKMGSRQLGIATISASLVGLGIWRALN